MDPDFAKREYIQRYLSSLTQLGKTHMPLAMKVVEQATGNMDLAFQKQALADLGFTWEDNSDVSYSVHSKAYDLKNKIKAVKKKQDVTHIGKAPAPYQ